jgi:hypothetical protein
VTIGAALWKGRDRIEDGEADAESAVPPSGPGATPTTAERFRVWAPNATAVAVTSDFSDWSAANHCAGQ